MTVRARRVAARAAAVALVGLIAQPSLARAATQAGQLAAACASCHRPDGADAGIPPVAGLAESRIVQAMLAYRSKQREAQIMNVVAAALSPEEIAAVAQYLAGQRPAAGRR